MPSVRLFVAVPASAAVRAAADGIMRELRGSGADCKWVDPDNLHLTLRFFGATPPEAIPDIEARMLGAARRPAFYIDLRSLGAFPSWDDPRVLWLGVGRGAGELGELAQALGPDPEGRDFSAHLTLGRMRGPRGCGRLRLAASGIESAVLTQKVEGMALYESRLGPNGPVYVVRKSQAFWG